jgi:hypothetical protein
MRYVILKEDRATCLLVHHDNLQTVGVAWVVGAGCASDPLALAPVAG